MILCYFDDSSDDGRKAFFACGGILGHESSWNEFERLWREETRQLREPFRSTDCECQHGQFKTWPKAECDALIERLVTLIWNTREGYHMGGFASVIPIVDYHAVFPNAGELDPYHLAVAHTILNMGQLASKHGETVKLCFENSSTAGRTLRIYQQLRQVDWPGRQRLQQLTFGSKELVPLQAADLIAREAMKHVRNRGIRQTRKPVKRLWEHIAFLLADRDALEGCKARGWPESVAGLSSWKESDNPPLPTRFYAANLREDNAGQSEM